MASTELFEKLSRYIKRQVDREVQRQLAIIREDVLQEVSVIIEHTERKMASRLDSRGNSSRGGSDYDRVRANLKSMPAYKDISESIAPKERINPVLRGILSETTPFDRSNSEPDTLSPTGWDDDSTSVDVGAPLLGTDNRPIDTTNEAVQNVLSILSRDHSATFQKISEAGDRFREMNS